MNIEIKEQREEKLLGRKTIKANISFEGKTPSRKEIRTELAKAIKEKEEKIIIKHIYTQYGGNKAEIEAAVYNKIEDAKAIENKKLIEKHMTKEENKEEAAEAKEENNGE